MKRRLKTLIKPVRVMFKVIRLFARVCLTSVKLVKEAHTCALRSLFYTQNGVMNIFVHLKTTPAHTHTHTHTHAYAYTRHTRARAHVGEEIIIIFITII